MKTSIICFSRTGRETAEKIRKGLDNCNVEIYVKGSFTTEAINYSLREWTEERFSDSDVIVFVSSCGIAVRAIAPFIVSKKTDPAVIVTDEMAYHCISLLSGHIGGANEMTRKIAEITGAEPVITTATDIKGKLAPDVFAVRNGCLITDFAKAKEAAATLVDGRSIRIINDGFETEYAVYDENGKRADDLSEETSYKIIVSPYAKYERVAENEKILWLIPQNIYVGIGCRRGISAELIADAVYGAFRQNDLDIRSMAALGSIDIKSEETGLIKFASDLGKTIKFFTAHELENIPGDFTESEFVRNTVGVGSVCERSAAIMAGGIGSIIQKKKSGNGITVSLAMKRGRLSFE